MKHQENHARKKLFWARNYIKQNSKVLDYSCGSGEFVKYLRLNSINAYGYDPNIKFNKDDSVDYLTDKKSGTNQKYEIIFMACPRAHHNPFGLIQKLKKNLKKNGKFLLQFQFQIL